MVYRSLDGSRRGYVTLSTFSSAMSQRRSERREHQPHYYQALVPSGPPMGPRLDSIGPHRNPLDPVGPHRKPWRALHGAHLLPVPRTVLAHHQHTTGQDQLDTWRWARSRVSCCSHMGWATLQFSSFHFVGCACRSPAVQPTWADTVGGYIPKSESEALGGRESEIELQHGKAGEALTDAARGVAAGFGVRSKGPHRSDPIHGIPSKGPHWRDPTGGTPLKGPPCRDPTGPEPEGPHPRGNRRDPLEGTHSRHPTGKTPFVAV